MAKYFLGSVGKAEAFRMEDGELKLAFVSKTLTDSGLNISTTKDDIRGGEGAPIQFSFYHDPNVEITLTDIQWKPEYVEAQLGAEFREGAHGESYKTVNMHLKSTDSTPLQGELVLEMPIPCTKKDATKRFAWASAPGSDEWFDVIVAADGKSITLPTGKPEGDYCVRFLTHDSSAKVAEITSTIIPQELFLIITAPIFAGDACAASKGKAAGYIQFEVPRFLLNGGQEFSMNMSSNQTMSLAGIALASESAECEANGGKLLRIIEVRYDRKWYDDIASLVADPDCLAVGARPSIYGVANDGHVVLASNDDLLFTPELKGGVFAAGTYSISVKEKATIKVPEDVVIPAE